MIAPDKLLDDCMATQIPLSLADSESTHVKRPLTRSPFRLQERWRSYTHLAVHDGERFSSEVLPIGIRFAPAAAAIAPFGSPLLRHLSPLPLGVLGLVWDQRASRFRFHQPASVHNCEAHCCDPSAFGVGVWCANVLSTFIAANPKPAEPMGSRADSSWIVRQPDQ